jgi:hypothetical protein
MKRFLSAVGLCIFLLLFGLFALLPSANAEKNLLENLLNLPAPPPPNPLVVSRLSNRSEEFFDKNKPPSDDVSIEDLVAYWQRINNYNQKFTYTPEPSPRALERLIEEVEANPEKMPSQIKAKALRSSSVFTTARCPRKSSTASGANRLNAG